MLTNRLYYEQGFVSDYEARELPNGKVKLEEELEGAEIELPLPRFIELRFDKLKIAVDRLAQPVR